MRWRKSFRTYQRRSQEKNETGNDEPDQQDRTECTVSGAAGIVSEGQPCPCRDGELGGGTFSEAGLRAGGAVLAVRKDEQHGLCRLSRAQHTDITMRFKTVTGGIPGAQRTDRYFRSICTASVFLGGRYLSDDELCAVRRISGGLSVSGVYVQENPTGGSSQTAWNASGICAGDAGTCLSDQDSDTRNEEKDMTGYFEFANPTRLCAGKGAIGNLAYELKMLQVMRPHDLK